MNYKIKTVFDLYKYSVYKYYDKLLFRTKYESVSYKNLDILINKYKFIMKEYGIKKGESIVYIGNNSIDWVAVHFACYPLGLRFVPIYKNQHKDVVEHIIKETECKLIFNQILDDINPTQYITINNNNINKNDLKEYNKEEYTPNENDCNLILYTSGTTGVAKGVLLSNRNLISNIQSIDRLIGKDFITQNDYYFSFLPWSHIYGLNCELLYGISKGSSFYINDNVNNLMDNIKKENPTIICTVPRLLYTIHNKLSSNPYIHFLLNNKFETISTISSIFIKNKIFGKNLRMINVGGSSISKEILEYYKKLDINIYQGYGLSETSPIISLNHSKLNKIGSVGQILDCNDVIILDEEILVKGSNVFQSYYNNKEETDKVFYNEYFMTGDTGYIDNEYYLYITGRKKELYKLDNGKYINPSYIESILLSSSKIKQIFIYGDNRPYNIALIVPNENVDINNIIKDINNYDLKKYEIPQKILFVEPFTIENKLLTPKLSLIRKNIYELYKDKINDLYNN